MIWIEHAKTNRTNCSTRIFILQYISENSPKKTKRNCVLLAKSQLWTRLILYLASKQNIYDISNFIIFLKLGITYGITSVQLVASATTISGESIPFQRRIFPCASIARKKHTKCHSSISVQPVMMLSILTTLSKPKALYGTDSASVVRYARNSSIHRAIPTNT